MSEELKKKSKRVQKLFKESNIEQKYYSRNKSCFLRDTVSARKKKIFISYYQNRIKGTGKCSKGSLHGPKDVCKN